MKPRSRLVMIAVLPLLAAATPAHAKDIRDVPLSQQVDQMKKDFCVSFKLSCKKTAKPARKPAATAGELAREIRQEPPAVIPVPRQRPERSEPQPAIAKSVEPAIPVPRPKPEKAEPPAEAATTIKVVTVKPKQAPPVETPAREATPASAGPDPCLASLRASKVEFETVAQPTEDASCSVVSPVQLRAVATPSGRVALPGSPVFNCGFALQFSLWLSDTASAAVLAQMKAPLAKVGTGPGFQCRGRNGDASAKMSEHATGNAVDIVSFSTADGRSIEVAAAGNPSSSSFNLLRGMRTAACGYFTTVLGPGSNEAHASHFHFDMGRHGKSGNYRICE